MPNDVTLDAGAHQLIILTGPNMGGKSTYLRQTALLCLMAQAGSFVPARSAKLPVVDRLFARVGASDNIARGQSTFMVEMQETANILHSATSRSLVILDEIGRGTATFDGLSLAWAVAEHLASNPRARPKTIFATHYHELTDLADALPSVANFHVVVREWKDDLVFLRKVVPGRSDRSYGIQVARLAGLPPAVVARAREILNGLERDELSRGGRPSLNGMLVLARPESRASARASARTVPGAGCRRRSARRAARDDRRRQPDAAAGAGAPRRAQARGGQLRAQAMFAVADRTRWLKALPIARAPLVTSVARLLLLPAVAVCFGRAAPRRTIRACDSDDLHAAFDIHFHQGEERKRGGSRVGRGVRRELERTLGRPRPRQVILVDQTDLSNGWATPLRSTPSRSRRRRRRAA